MKSFKMTDNGEAKFILGMHIQRNPAEGTITIDQHKYVKEVLERFGMGDSHPVSTPADVNSKLTNEMSPSSESDREEMKKIPYQEAVGSLLYAAQVSRPDIQYAVNMVSRFNHNPGKAHWMAVKRIMRYLNGTRDMKLCYQRDEKEDLHGFCDADWAGDVSDRRSVTGYVFLLQGSAITWNSKKQPTVALSTTEAEYMAMSSSTQEAIWLKNLYNDIFGNRKRIEQITIFGDNQSAIALSDKTTSFHPRTKHIDIRHHFIREHIHNGDVKFIYTNTDNMTADFLTKAVTHIKHKKCCESMNIIH